MPKALPSVDPQLIEWLEAQYPNRVPDIEARDRDVWAAVGQQQVITYLKAVAAKIERVNLARSRQGTQP